MTAEKYLTFTLDNEEYAVPVIKVREIINMMHITKVPQLPQYVKGVINLRGRVMPVVDVRLKLGLPAADYSERTCIVVVDVVAASGAVMMGVIVDSVSDVLTIAVDQLTAPDEYKATASTWITGLAKVSDRLTILLNIDRMLGADGELIHAA
jgi:purine-binding chemotaxis protein CheW